MIKMMKNNRKYNDMIKIMKRVQWLRWWKISECNDQDDEKDQKVQWLIWLRRWKALESTMINMMRNIGGYNDQDDKERQSNDWMISAGFDKSLYVRTSVPAKLVFVQKYFITRYLTHEILIQCTSCFLFGTWYLLCFDQHKQKSKLNKLRVNHW